MSNNSNASQLRFYYNGIKAHAGAKLEKAWFCGGETGVTIYGKHYASFSRAIRAELCVRNESDMMTDYFENDRIFVAPEHPHFAAALAAVRAGEARNAARRARREQAANVSAWSHRADVDQWHNDFASDFEEAP